MSALLPDPVDEPAPHGALAWSPSRGFILNAEDLDEAQLEGGLSSMSPMAWSRRSRVTARSL